MDKEGLGTLLGTFSFADVETKYPFHQVRHIKNAEDGKIYDIPAGASFEDGIEDKEDFDVTIYEAEEKDDAGNTYKFYSCFDEGDNEFSMIVYEPEEVEDE